MPDQQVQERNRGTDLEFLREQILFAVEGSAYWRRQKAEEYLEDTRNERSAGALDRLAERLAALPSEHRGFRALAPVWFASGSSATEAQSHFIGRYGFDWEEDADPEVFLDSLLEVLSAADAREPQSDTAATPLAPSGLVSDHRSEGVGLNTLRVRPTIYAGDNANIVIKVNTGSAEMAAALEKIDDMLDLLRGSNEISQDTKQELTGEIAAGVAAVKSGRANRTYLDLLLFRPLRWMAEIFAGSAIGTAASEAIKALTKALTKALIG